MQRPLDPPCENAGQVFPIPDPRMADDDPRVFPDAAMAPKESARLHALAAASQAAIGQQATILDGQIREALAAMLAPGSGERLAAVFATAPSAAVHRHLWRLLPQFERSRAAGEAPRLPEFALPVIRVARLERVQGLPPAWNGS